MIMADRCRVAAAAPGGLFRQDVPIERCHIPRHSRPGEVRSRKCLATLPGGASPVGRLKQFVDAPHEVRSRYDPPQGQILHRPRPRTARN